MSKNYKSLWSFFSSIRLTIVLIALFVLVFAVGTFLPSPGMVDFARQPSSAIADFFLFLNLDDLYHSPLFYILMALFSLNLIVCSLNRLPLLHKKYKAPHFPEGETIFADLPQDQTITTHKDIDAVRPVIFAALKDKYKSVQTKDTAKGWLFYGERGRFTVFRVYAIHLSILIIIAGAVVGSIFALEADVYIREGTSTNMVRLTKEGGWHQLDFLVRCDKFTIEYYENGSPKTYRSDLSFIRDSQVVQQGVLLVNHPLTFGGLQFYQAGYRLSPDPKALLAYTDNHKKSAKVMVAEGDTFAIPEQNATVTVLRVEEDIMAMGPAVKLKITAAGKDFQFWVFHQIDEIVAANPGILSDVPFFNPGLFKPLVFSLQRLEQQGYTGLRVTRDPGVPIVALGGVLLIFGIIVVFFMPYQRFWVIVEQEEGKLRIRVAGRDDRNNSGLQRNIDQLRKRISGDLQA